MTNHHRVHGRAERTRARIVSDGAPLTGVQAEDLLAEVGTPILTDHPSDPTVQRALFVWLPPQGAAVGGVYLWVNRLTDKRRTPRGMMWRRPESDLWFVELDVPRDTLVGYRILPLAPDDAALQDGRVPAPHELLRDARVDPHNRLAATGSPFGSVLVTADAPGLEAWTEPVSAPSGIEDGSVDLDGTGLRYRLAVAPGDGPSDLLIVFDADQWFDRFRLPDVLARPGRRVGVLGIDSPADPAERLRFLAADGPLLDALADRVLPSARKRIGPVGRVVIAGQSLGGVAALAFAAAYPDAVDEVLAYSPSVWWRPGLVGRPADVATRQDWIHDLIAACPPGAFAIRLASGAFEDELGPGVIDLARTAAAAGHDVTHTEYSGGHDHAQWAALLLEHLGTGSGTTGSG